MPQVTTNINNSLKQRLEEVKKQEGIESTYKALQFAINEFVDGRKIGDLPEKENGSEDSESASPEKEESDVEKLIQALRDENGE